MIMKCNFEMQILSLMILLWYNKVFTIYSCFGFIFVLSYKNKAYTH